MNKTLMHLAILQTGLLYFSGFATAQYFVTHSDSWGFVAVATTVFLLMVGKWEVHKRIEVMLGPLPEALPETKEAKTPSKEKPEGTVGFCVPLTK